MLLCFKYTMHQVAFSIKDGNKVMLLHVDQRSIGGKQESHFAGSY